MNRIIALIVTAAGLASSGCVDGPGKRSNQMESPDPNRVTSDATQLQKKIDRTDRRTEDAGDSAIVKHDLYIEQQREKDENYSEAATDK